MKPVIAFLMKQPVLYKLVQEKLAGGGHKVIQNFLMNQIPKNTKTILDQGCGTGEYALLFGEKYTGIDIDSGYMKFARKKYPGKFIVGDATNMRKLKNNSFEVVFAVGLHHHLTDDDATKAFNESLRVVKRGGKVVVIDAMLPRKVFNIPGLFLRKIDRGGHVRRFDQTLGLLPGEINYRAGVLSSFPFDYITVVFNKD